jgi:hypothetical protein
VETFSYTRLVYAEHDSRILEIGSRVDVQRRVLDSAGKFDVTVTQLCYEVAEQEVEGRFNTTV